MKDFLQLIACLSMLLCCAAFSGEPVLDGFFFLTDRHGEPLNWKIISPDQGNKEVRLFSAPGPRGKKVLHAENSGSAPLLFQICPVRARGRSGDKLVLSSQASGTGEFFLRYYDKSGQLTGCSPAKLLASPGMPEIRSTAISLTNAPAGETVFFDLVFRVPAGGKMRLSGIYAALEESPVRGEIPFPVHWQVFAPLPDQFKPSQADLVKIPATLNGVKPHAGELLDGRMDLASFLGGKSKSGKCAWLYAPVHAPCDSDYTFGCAADWWMTLYVNGIPQIDTSAVGNIKYPFAIDNHVATVRLKKGWNLLAVKFISGASSSVFYAGGPEALRCLTPRIRFSKVLWQEDFEGKTVTCTGNPERKTAYAATGILDATGQGVFRTSSSLRIAPPSGVTLILPDDGAYGAAGLRIQEFSKSASSALDFHFSDAGGDMVLSIENHVSAPRIQLKLSAPGITRQYSYPRHLFPLEVTFCARKSGSCSLILTSLKDHSTRIFQENIAFFAGRGSLQHYLTLRSLSGKTAALALDNYRIGFAEKETAQQDIPLQIRHTETFDPVKAGWKLVFEDDFSGTCLNEKLWCVSPAAQADHVSLRDGKLVIRTDWNRDRTALETGKIYSRQGFLYGYFEARLRFTRQPGWWAAFWLYAAAVSNSMHDGAEIDIFEDFYLRPHAERPRFLLAHCLHFYLDGKLKSFNYNSELPGSRDDFYTIGCKWTPEEISCYLNGKEIRSKAIHSPYDSVTFDACRHGTIAVPLNLILSGQCRATGGDPSQGVFPEEFLVDYVRVYAYPNAEAPAAVLGEIGSGGFAVRERATLVFDVSAQASAGSSVRSVSLFDSGFLLETKKQPPYRFHIPLTKAYYDLTGYVKPGYSGRKIAFAPTFHDYAAMVQDSKGRTRLSNVIRKWVEPDSESSPFRGRRTELPGTIRLPEFDEGGHDVAYHDTSHGNQFRSAIFRNNEDVDTDGNVISYLSPGEWWKYSVHIRKAGRYSVKLRYGTAPLNQTIKRPHGLIHLLADSRPVGNFTLLPAKHSVLSDAHTRSDGSLMIKKGGPSYVTVDAEASAVVDLPAGNQVITVLADCSGFNLADLTFTELKEQECIPE